jgi:hypothetical protein
MKESPEKCESCASLIGDAETPCIWKEHVVCSQCRVSLERVDAEWSARSSAAGNKEKGWRASRPHLLMLSKFLPYSHPGAFPGDWSSVLGETPASAIKRFLDEGCIEPCSLDAKVDMTFKVPGLKNLLKSSGLKCTGPKANLIARLIEHDRPALARMTDDFTGFQCTASTRQQVESFISYTRAERCNAEWEVLALLTQQDFKSAALRMGRYEAMQVFPRGMGIDWQNYDETSDAKCLRDIFGSIPAILRRVDGNRINPLRLAAGMMFLWGTSNAKKWLPPGFVTGMHLDGVSACRMFVFYASHRRTLRNLGSTNVERVQIQAASDDGTCSECCGICGKEYPVGEVPELPYSACSCTDGCRCCYSPIVDGLQ